MIASYFSITGTPLSDNELQRINAWWRTANYLSSGQIYPLDNPLLKQPLAPRTHQTAATRPLGHNTEPEHDLCPSEPGDQVA